MMASSLLRLTRSVVPLRLPTFNITRQHSDKTRSFCSPSGPNNTVTFDIPFLMSHMQLMAGAPSMLITVVNGEQITVNIPGMSKTETDNGPCVSINMQGLRMPKGEYQAVSYDEHIDIEDNNILFYFKTHSTKHIYLAAVNLPHNLDWTAKYNVLISKGVFNLTLPVIESNDYVMPDLVDATVKMPRPTPYCEMFDRSALGKELCLVMAHPDVKSKSFTGYKKDTGESIYIKGNMPGVETNVITNEGLCVSLDMPGLEIEDVELGFEYETLIIEGKRGNEHYIAGIRVPEGFHRETHMIKREMQDGMFKATLPHDEGGKKKTNRRVFSVYR